MTDYQYHRKIRVSDGIHGIVSFECADEAARLALTGFEASDLYKIAIQLDDNSLWILVSISPISWVNTQSNNLVVGGDLDGYLPNPQVVNLHIPGQAAGNLLYFNGTNYIPIPLGPDGYILQANTAFTKPEWVSQAVGTNVLTNIKISAGTTSNNLSAFTLLNSNGVSFGLNNGIITATVQPGAAAGIGGVSAGTQNQTSGTLVFSNSNNISFGMNNGSVITGSASFPAQTNQNIGLYGIGNTIGESSSSTFDARSISLSGAGNISVGYSNGAVIISQTGAGFINVSGGSTSNDLSAITFSNANNVSFGLDGSTITGSASYPAQTQFVFSNSNGISFGTDGSTITASYTVPNVPAQTSLSFQNGNNVSFGINGSTLTASVPTQTAYQFSNSNGISFGSNGSTVTASYTVPTQTAFVFSNSNGLTFGTNGSTVTGSYSQAAQTVQTQNIVVPSAGTQTATSGTVVFSNSNGITFGMSGSSRITASHNGITSQTAFVLSNSNGISFGTNGSTITASYTTPTQSNQTVGLYGIGNTTQNSSTTLDARTLSFNGLGGMTIGYSNGSIQLSAPQTVAQTNQTLGFFATGNTTQNSSTTRDARSITFNGLGAASVGFSNGSVQISVPNQSVQTQGFIQAIYDGAASISSGTIRFSNSNGITFGANGQTITASHNAITSQTNQTIGGYAFGGTAGESSSSTIDARSLSFHGSGGISVGYSNGSVVLSVNTAGGGALTNINVSAGTTSNNLSALTFADNGNISFGLNDGTITATVNQTNQTVGLYGLGNTTQNSSTTRDARSISFNGLGNITVGFSNGSVQLSGSQSAQTQNVVVPSAGTQTATSGTLVFSNSNNISFGMSGSTRITASVNAISNINLSAGTTSNNASNFTFADGNGVSFGLNAGTITASIGTQTNQTIGLFGLGNTTQNSSTTRDARSLSFNGLGIITVGYSNGSIQLSATTSQSNQTIGGYVDGNTIGQSSSSTIDARSLTFKGNGGVSIGYSNGSVIFDVNTAGGGALTNINVSAGTTSNNLSALTFSNINGVSFGLNASTITASVSQSIQTIGLYGVGNTTQSSSTTRDARSLSFNGAGNITVGFSNGSVQISGSQSAQTQSNIQAIYDGANSISTGTIRFTNANGVSFSINGQTISGSVAAQTNQTIGLFALGNTTQNSSTTMDARSLSFNGLGAATIGYSNGSIQISVPTQTVQTQGLVQALYDGAASISSGTARFSNSNGISFGFNGQTITASHNAITSQTNQTAGLYGLGNTTQNSSTTLDVRSLSFNGLGGNTIGYSNGSIQISGPTTNGLISGINVSAGTTSNNLTAFTIANGNGLEFGLDNGVITGSYTQAAQTNQTLGLFATGNTTQSSSTIRDARSITLNALGNITVGFSNGSIQISGSQSAQTQSNIQAIYDGANSITTGTIRFSNSNGISFGVNGQTITASHNGITTQTNQTLGGYAAGNTTGQSSSSTFDARTLSLNGAGIVSVGYSNSSVMISATQSTQTQNVVVPSAGTQTATSGTVVWSNSNNITFGMSGSSRITGSYNFNISGGTTSNNLNAITFADGNGVSFGLNASTLTASVSQSIQTVGLYGLGNTTQNSSTTRDARSLSFNGLGIITVGYSNGSIQLSATQSAQSLGGYALGNTAGQSSSSTLDARSLSFSGQGIASVGYSNGAVIISVPSAAGNINVSAGTTSNNLNAITFADSNGISFGIDASTITASYTVPTQTNQTIGFFATGNTTQNSSTTRDARSITLNGLGAATLGFSNGSIQVSVPVQSAQTQNVVVPTAGGNSITSGTMSFSNVNGISFGINGQTITASHNGITSQTNQTQGFYALGNTTGQSSSSTFDARTISLNGAGIISVGYSNSSVLISATQSAQTQSVVVPSAGTQTATSGTVIWSNSNNLTFGMSGSSRITASYNFNISGGTTSNNLNAITFANGNGVSFGLNASTITASISQSNQTIGGYAIGNTTGQSSSSTIDARSLSFSGAGNISVGYSGGSVIISATGGGGGITNINVSAGTTSNNLSALTFSNANGVSFGLDASTITASINQVSSIGLYALGNTTQNSSTTLDQRTISMNGLGALTVGYSNGSVQLSAPAASNITASNGISLSSNGSTISIYGTAATQIIWPPCPWQTNFAIANASFSLQHLNMYQNITATKANLLMNMTGNTNSSGALTISLGIYTMSGSTMSLASSGSQQISWTSNTNTSASSQYGGVSGTRYRTVGIGTWNISAGDYMLGIWFRTTNNGTWSAYGVQGPAIVGAVDANETNAYLNGYSTSSFTTGMIASINLTDTNYVRTGSPALQQPGIIFLGTH